MRRLTPFCTKTNLRENRFFAARWRLVDKMSTHNVKFLAEKITVADGLTGVQVNKKAN